MNVKTKSAFVLLGMLILGLVLGVMLRTAIHNKQVERTRSLRERGALSEVIENVVKPHDEAQALAVREIVTRYEEVLGELMRESRRTRSAVFDSMHQELSRDVLSADQVQALDDWRARNRHGNKPGGASRNGSIPGSDSGKWDRTNSN
ncbi:MAG: hypothetical protein BMS9Abin05_1546 [Rhodothermia bacterium]|nr:MAG: hypothetical protein BMS9Abin05_1546 [Rhodothermia bacterium]